MKTNNLKSCIETGTVDEVYEIISLMHNLPEFGLQSRVQDIAALHNQVLLAEAALENAKRLFRSAANGLVQTVSRAWTKDEIKQATGY